MPGEGSKYGRVGEGAEKKPEIDAEIEWDVIEKKSVPLDTEGGVKVLSEKTGSDDNFQNDRLGPDRLYKPGDLIFARYCRSVFIPLSVSDLDF